jgi:acetate kinase
MSGAILTLNSGSSSLKFALFDNDASQATPEIIGKISGIGTTPVFSVKDANGNAVAVGAFGQLDTAAGHAQAIALLLPWLAKHLGDASLAAVGHRVVHGGQFYCGPVRITDAVLDKLDTLIPLAPLHQPHNLAAIRAIADWQPSLPQIACFDTSFHRSQNRLAKQFALPRNLSEEGIIRYGFHGLSYDYIASVLPQHLGELADGRVIVAHLGNGASMCAMQNRKSVATSMGFTALDGLMMGTRCGALDPGVVLYLLQAKGMKISEVEDLLYRQSGLMGVSGISNDMQALQASDDPHASEAIDLYCFKAASILAGLVPSIGGIDALVFTAGIGENSALVRADICKRLQWLGVVLDPDANAGNAGVISVAQSPVKVLVVPTNEEAVVARGCRALLS